MMRHFKCFLFLFLGVISAQANSSLVKLDSGEQLLGEVLPQSNDAVLVLRSNLLGEVELPRSRVLVIEAREPETEAAKEKRGEIVKSLRELKAPDIWSGNLRGHPLGLQYRYEFLPGSDMAAH